MNLGLEGKRVLVTGGSKGIGKGIVRAFIEEGAHVGISARGKENLDLTKEEFPTLETFQGDLIIKSEREKVFHDFVKTFGGVDILINNVGGSNGSTTMETPIELFEEAMNLNYLSAVHFSQLSIPFMRKKKAGSIVNISSVFGREAGGKPTYNAAKAAMISFTKSLADELVADGIRVNGVAPGSILHPTGNWQRRINENPEKMAEFVRREIPSGRFGTVKEIGDVVVFLASERANWIVGATINVDGGQSRSNF